MRAQHEPGWMDRVIAWLSAVLLGLEVKPVPIRIERETRSHPPRRL